MEPDDSPPHPVPILDYLYGAHNIFHNGSCVLNESQTFRTEQVINSFTRVTYRPTINRARKHSCMGHHHDVLEISYVCLCLCSTGYSMVQQNNGCKWIQTGIIAPWKINTDLRIKNHKLRCEFLINNNSSAYIITHTNTRTHTHIYIYYLRSLKFTLKHLKRSYMFRSHDHLQGAYIFPC